VPAVIEAELPEATVRRRSRRPMRQADRSCGIIIEIELDGVTVRVGRGADAKTVATVLRALKADA
jgi:transposase